MGLLDRFRRARWQHPAASVRALAVRELGAEAFERCIETAVPLSRQLVAVAGEGCDLGTPEGRARMLKQAGQQAPEVKPVLEVNPEHALVKKLEACEHLDDLAHILFDQALLAEGGQLEDPAAYVRRINALLVTAAV